MDVDEGENEAEATLVPLLVCRLPYDVFVTVIDNSKDVQAQWWVVPLMGQIFTTKNEDSLRDKMSEKFEEFVGIHSEVWPGYTIPPLLKSKFESENHKRKYGTDESKQPVYLRQKTVPTSIAIASLIWALSKPKRMHREREKGQQFMRGLLGHVLAVAGTLKFDIAPVGTKNARVKRVEISTRNEFFDSSDLWDGRLKGRIWPTWELQRLGKDPMISSNWDRPQWIDLILFCLDPSNNVPILKPVVFTILAQLAAWIDDNLSRLAVGADTLDQQRQKTRGGNAAITKDVLVKAATFLLFENEPCSAKLKSYHCYGVGFCCFPCRIFDFF